LDRPSRLCYSENHGRPSTRPLVDQYGFCFQRYTLYQERGPPNLAFVSPRGRFGLGIRRTWIGLEGQLPALRRSYVRPKTIPNVWVRFVNPPTSRFTMRTYIKKKKKKNDPAIRAVGPCLTLRTGEGVGSHLRQVLATAWADSGHGHARSGGPQNAIDVYQIAFPARMFGLFFAVADAQFRDIF